MDTPWNTGLVEANFSFPTENVFLVKLNWILSWNKIRKTFLRNREGEKVKKLQHWVPVNYSIVQYSIGNKFNRVLPTPSLFARRLYATNRVDYNYIRTKLQNLYMLQPPCTQLPFSWPRLGARWRLATTPTHSTEHERAWARSPILTHPATQCTRDYFYEKHHRCTVWGVQKGKRWPQAARPKRATPELALKAVSGVAHPQGVKG
jgi:hypothetical protein